MSARTTLIIFAVLFAAALFTIVAVPFFISKGPQSPSTAEKPEAAAPVDRGVFRSDDGGKTWQQKSWVEGESGSIASFRVNRLVADPVHPETLYLLTDGDGLWMSQSRGDLWTRVQDVHGVLSPQSNVLALAVNPRRGAEWYVAVFQENHGRLLRTDDGGKTFREVYTTPRERFGVFDAWYDSEHASVDIVTGEGMMLETANQGSTWRLVRLFADGLLRFLTNPASPSVRFVTTPHGSIFRTEDRGGTWTDVTPALRSYAGALEGQRWFVDRAGTLYLGSRYGLLRSRDNTATFEAPPLIIPPDALPVLAVAVDPRDTAHLVVSAASQLYESRDGGGTWAMLPSPGKGRITHLLFDAAERGALYAVVEP